MRIALLSDIHGNLPALEAVIGAIAEGGIRIDMATATASHVTSTR